jgi:hypothetical protein
MFKINYTVNEEIKRISILRLSIAKNKFAQLLSYRIFAIDKP